MAEKTPQVFRSLEKQRDDLKKSTGLFRETKFTNTPRIEKYPLIREGIRQYYLSFYLKFFQDTEHHISSSILSLKKFISEWKYDISDRDLVDSIVMELVKVIRNKKIPLSDIEWFQILSWWYFILHIRWQEPLELDITAPSLERLFVKKKAAFGTEQLREEISIKRISLFWGSLIATIWPQIQEWYIYLKKVTIPWDIFWDIKLNWKFFTLDEVEKSIFRQLESKWITYNPKTNTFFKEAKWEISYRKLESALKNYSYNDYKKIAEKSWVPTNEILSKTKFEADKTSTRQKLFEIHTKYLKSWNWTSFWRFILRWHFETLVKLWGKILHFILLPVFFHAAHKNWQDLGSIFESVTEAWLFVTWAHIWWKLPIPVLWKMLAWIMLGWAFVFWGKYIWEHLLDIDRNFTRAFPNREDFVEKRLKNWGISWFDKKSYEWHIVTSFMLYEAADWMGSDIKIPWTDIVFFQHDIDAGTDPRLYLQLWFFRNREFRNERQAEFQARTTKFFRELFWYDGFTWEPTKFWFGKTSTDLNKPELQEKIVTFLASKNASDGIPSYQKTIIERVTNLFVENKSRIENKEVKFSQILNLALVELEKLEINIINTDRIDAYENDMLIEKLIIDSSLDWTFDFLKWYWDISDSSLEFKYINDLSNSTRKMLKSVFEKTQKREDIFKEINGNELYTLLWNNIFYAGVLSENEKTFLIEYFKSLQKNWVQSGVFKKWQEDKLLNEITTVLNGKITDIRNVSVYVRNFLTSIMENNSQKLPFHSKIALQEWKKTLESISKKSHWGKLFYQFFNRLIDQKRKREFIESMRKDWTPIQSKSYVLDPIFDCFEKK